MTFTAGEGALEGGGASRTAAPAAAPSEPSAKASASSALPDLRGAWARGAGGPA